MPRAASSWLGVWESDIVGLDRRRVRTAVVEVEVELELQLAKWSGGYSDGRRVRGAVVRVQRSGESGSGHYSAACPYVHCQF